MDPGVGPEWGGRDAAPALVLRSGSLVVGVIARFVRRITLRVAVGDERYARILAG